MIAAFSNYFQSKMLVVYRLASFFVLIAIIGGIFGYIALLFFYLQSNNWGAPLVISPAQERVLSYQPQVAQLRAQLDKQRTDLVDLTAQLGVKKEGLQALDALIARTTEAQQRQIQNMSHVSKNLSRLVSLKSGDIADSERAHAQLKGMMASTDAEMRAGLISKEDAAARMVTLQSSANALTDSKIAAMQVGVNSTQSRAVMSTLGGAADDLQTMTTLAQTQQMIFSRMQLKAEIDSAQGNLGVLRAGIKESERILAVAMRSPYYKALTQPVSVAFVPYENMERAKAGEPVYDCILQIFLCKQVGKVAATYDAEEYAKHPLFRYDLKGKLVEVNFTDPASSTSRVVFFGRKPLLL
ncbi:hypothetical protein N5I87_18055 [Ralstonia sp. CHL-2022]|uniref:Uncharacterized protein n=1 Tax=Ralstonia mojiangensis TaxID=2953895 RepID=A0AAE3I5T9_9RALS|nr:hypothetical protein [Ralstonia mojiangensis]MCT7317920.1 hypothetical protein [Ralstonia mojiangensis]